MPRVRAPERLVSDSPKLAGSYLQALVGAEEAFGDGGYARRPAVCVDGDDADIQPVQCLRVERVLGRAAFDARGEVERARDL